jgi:hypothetical protein
MTGRCGKANGRRNQAGHLGHGTRFRLTRKKKGKTAWETFPSPAASRKAQREVAELHRFQALRDRLVEVNEKICPLRPMEGEEGLSEQGEKRRKRSGRKSRGKWISPCGWFFRIGARRAASIWKPRSWRYARPCTGRVRPPGAHCSNSRHRTMSNAACPVLAANEPTTTHGTPSRF